MAPFVPGAHHIELASGRYLDLVDPDPVDITLEDVAHALANTCRYAGHTRRFYSVAEHAVLVADRLAAMGALPAVVLAGLHHDDAEAFVGDVARPLKSLLPEFDVIEARCAAAVRVALRLPELSPESGRLVKEADDWALACEAYRLMPSRGAGWFCDGLYNAGRGGELAATRRIGLSPRVAKFLYLTRHHALVDSLEAGS